MVAGLPPIVTLAGCRKSEPLIVSSWPATPELGLICRMVAAEAGWIVANSSKRLAANAAISLSRPLRLFMWFPPGINQ